MKHHLEMIRGNIIGAEKLPKASAILRDAAVAKIMKQRSRNAAKEALNKRYGSFGGDRLAVQGGGMFLTEPRIRRMTIMERAKHLLHAVRVGCILLVRRLFRRRTS